MNYLDFDIELRVHDDLYYQVAVRAPGGAAASAVVAFPFTDAELERHLLRLENAILRSVGRRRQPQTEEERLLQTFGQQMFDFLFAGEGRALYYESLRESRHRQGLRLRLQIHAPALALLPWEFLYDPRRGDYVCLDPYTPLVRYPDLPQRVQPLPVTPPLQVLGMVASPADLQELDVATEQANVERALKDLKERGLVELTWLPGNTAQELRRFMSTSAGPWHIFHFIGHGGFDATRNEGVLYLADEQNRSRAIGATQLSRLLAGQRYALRLVLLNACEGARSGQEDVLSSTAATLVRSGLPAVLAMQHDITDSAAVAFAQSFYEAVANLQPVDTAVADARNAISLVNEHSLEWGTPVLYMRSPDGHLFVIDDNTQTGSNSADETLPARSQAETKAATADRSVSSVAQPSSDKATAAPTDKPTEVQAQPSTPTLDTPTRLTTQSPVRKPPPILEFDWVTIPAGPFWMGSRTGILGRIFGAATPVDAMANSDEQPQHQVVLPLYRIARVPVTNAQYKHFTDATGHPQPTHWQDGQIPPGKENHPVVYVSWHDAVAFCQWAGVRLPTEAEWEKTARGTDGRLWPWGNEPPDQERCNFNRMVGATTPVGAYTKGASPYGVLEMAGNVWEWTSSLYQAYPYKIDDGREDLAAAGRRVWRGGSFASSRGRVRCATRGGDVPGARVSHLGFRLLSLGS